MSSFLAIKNYDLTTGCIICCVRPFTSKQTKISQKIQALELEN